MGSRNLTPFIVVIVRVLNFYIGNNIFRLETRFLDLKQDV